MGFPTVDRPTDGDARGGALMSTGPERKGFVGKPWVSPRLIDRLTATLEEVLP
jgi:hypothetical protein